MRILISSALVICAAGPAASQQPPAAPRELVSRVDYEPMWSSDGRQIVFVSNRSGAFNVYAMNADGSGVRQITSHAGPDDTPAISPDGRQIVFVSEIDGNPELYTVPASGGIPHRVTRTPGPDLHPHWSPDGKSILYNAGDSSGARFDVREIPVAGGSGRSFTAGGINTYASWSADGKRIVYRRSVGDNKSQLRVITVATGHDDALTDGKFFDGWPSWSPDGTRIVFASDRSGRFDIYSVASGGGQPVKIATAGERATNPRLAPDGTLMFTARRGRAIDIFVVR